MGAGSVGLALSAPFFIYPHKGGWSAGREPPERGVYKCSVVYILNPPGLERPHIPRQASGTVFALANRVPNKHKKIFGFSGEK